MNTQQIESQDSIINQAISILESRAKYNDIAFTDPNSVKKYLRLKIGNLEHEVFFVMFLNNRHELIDSDVMFRGTIDCSSVYPREVAKEALKHNAAALIIAHNHPSGNTNPSTDDKNITNKINKAMQLLDIRLLDHIVVSSKESTSFAESGLL